MGQEWPSEANDLARSGSPAEGVYEFAISQLMRMREQEELRVAISCPLSHEWIGCPL